MIDLRELEERVILAAVSTSETDLAESSLDELKELADAGVDLDLCGHTHNGQTFPGNFTIKLMWENPCGLLSKDNMTNITTSGAGVWGPAMRIGTDSEICSINIQLKKA